VWRYSHRRWLRPVDCVAGRVSWFAAWRWSLVGGAQTHHAGYQFAVASGRPRPHGGVRSVRPSAHRWQPLDSFRTDPIDLERTEKDPADLRGALGIRPEKSVAMALSWRLCKDEERSLSRTAERIVTQEPSDDDATCESGIDRRKLIKSGGLLAGTAWVAPVVFDSFASPAAAATADFPFTKNVANTYTVGVPAFSKVDFTLIGGGGAGGNDVGGAGGAGAKLTGQLPARSSDYTLTVVVGGGGSIGQTGTGNTLNGGAGGSGYMDGASGGNGYRFDRSDIWGYDDRWSGPGGGGGGASALTFSTSPIVRVVAPGGAGGGGGGAKPSNDRPGGSGGSGPASGSIVIPGGLSGGSGVGGTSSGYGGGGGGGATATNGGTAGAFGDDFYDGDSGTAGSNTAAGAGGNGADKAGLDGGGGGGGGGGYRGGGGGGGGGASASLTDDGDAHGGGGGGAGSAHATGATTAAAVARSGGDDGAGGTGGGAGSANGNSGNVGAGGTNGDDGYVLLTLA
jgi:hypothetical protein